MARENATLIKERGEYNVTICSLQWQKLEPKDGDNERIALVIPCFTEPDAQHPNGQRSDFHMNFIRTIIQKGENAGKPMFQLSQENCLKLGMSAPFHPTKIGELEGKKATLVMENEEYNGKTTCKAKYLNPVRKPAMKIAEVNDIWAKLVSDQPAEVLSGDSDNEVPF